MYLSFCQTSWEIFIYLLFLCTATQTHNNLQARVQAVSVSPAPVVASLLNPGSGRVFSHPSGTMRSLPSYRDLFVTTAAFPPYSFLLVAKANVEAHMNSPSYHSFFID